MTYATSAFVLLGTSFAFDGDHLGEGNAFIAWYVVMVVEMIVNVSSTLYWPELDFRRTCLTERMSLLTLIILGEGVIGLLESATTAWKSVFYYSGFISTVTSALLILVIIHRKKPTNLLTIHSTFSTSSTSTTSPNPPPTSEPSANNSGLSSISLSTSL